MADDVLIGLWRGKSMNHQVGSAGLNQITGYLKRKNQSNLLGEVQRSYKS